MAISNTISTQLTLFSFFNELYTMYDKYTTCNIQEVNRLRQEAHYFRLGGLLSQLAEVAGPRLGVDGAVMISNEQT